MQSGSVHVDVDDRFVATVTLARPPVNALNGHLREQLTTAFDSLQERDDVRAVVLAANGPVFCAGADIKEKQAQAAAAGEQRRAERLTRETFFAVLDSAKPVVAAVNGAALGAGAVLTACCDVVVAAETAFFGMPEIDVGQAGGASFLHRMLPPATVRRMVLTGERVPAAEMYRLGAVAQCVPRNELLLAAGQLAAVLAAKSPSAVRAIRTSFTTVDALSLRDGFRLEQTITADVSRGADAAEARRAFVEKRAAVFGPSQPPSR
ncbi:enoyl-CoA hydratase/isomerase family protein [Jiangella asiatica]|uniref:Enoyl-CoA hydratase/isomerase family protein n=1 Tax=Jiangella asiatica TaxID=2530372 RepID=A0A4R5CRE3_9ACTN|nr:enoyl-CoA hydratase/isomerase family protein [Jiangella asiatica]TDE03112.1 enoyl-CoA hydratase/isomerase family protein [Jiangella asiatica]